MMVKKRSSSSWEADPEIGELQVRYSAYVVKTPKKSRLYPEKRKFLPYGVEPIVDCEIDDDDEKPDYLSYAVIPKEHTETIKKVTEQTKEFKKTKVKPKPELSLDNVYEVISQLKLPIFQKVIRQNKFQLLHLAKHHPDRHHLYVTRLLLKTIFTPVQKVWIYSQIREVLNIPPNEFANVQYVYTVLSPEVALMVLKYKFKCFAKICDDNQLSALSLLNSKFFDKRFDTDLHCRT